MRFSEHQRRSPRLGSYDYTQSGTYFVTLVTFARESLLGAIDAEGMMACSAAGQIAQRFWNAIPEHFPAVELDAFVVMPNHVHGILVFNEPQSGRDGGRSEGSTQAGYGANKNEDGRGESIAGHSVNKNEDGREPNAGHGGAVSLRETFGKPVGGSLGTVMRSYKAIVTRTIREMAHSNIVVWQGRYYDHIVRDEADLNRIREYIANNPAQWRKDTLFGQ